MLLAPAPSYFEHSHRVVSRAEISIAPTNQFSDYSMTNKGLQIERQLYFKTKTPDEDLKSVTAGRQVIAALNCVDEVNNCRIALQLTMCSGSLIPGHNRKRLLVPFDSDYLLTEPMWTTQWQKIIIQNRQYRDSRNHNARHYGRGVTLRHPPTVIPKIAYEMAENKQGYIILPPTSRITSPTSARVIVLGLQGQSDVLLVFDRSTFGEPPRLALLHTRTSDSPRVMLERARELRLSAGPIGCAMLKPKNSALGVLLAAQVKPICGVYGELQSVVCIEYPVQNVLVADVATLFIEQGSTTLQSPASGRIQSDDSTSLYKSTSNLDSDTGSIGNLNGFCHGEPDYGMDDWDPLPDN